MITSNTDTTTINIAPPRRIMTKADVCKTYVISVATLDRLIRNHRFPHMKIGSRTLFRVEDVERFFDSHVRCLN